MEVAGLSGLRERKKAKTHLAIQEAALRLFREQGYEATTVEQIAAAAEVSPSTYFRYFPTKEDVVIHDALDPLLFASFAEQPAELSPIQALRASMAAVFGALTPEELAFEYERQELVLGVPELRARMLDDLATKFRGFAEALGARVGPPAGNKGTGLLCNQAVHSFIFCTCLDETGAFDGVFFASDREKDLKLYGVAADVLVQILRRVGNDYPSSVRFHRDWPAGPFKVTAT